LRNSADDVFCILSLGSNIGDRKANLREAIDKIASHDKITLVDVASLYETEPVGYADQPDFLNTCISIRTSLEPLRLLDVTSSIENEMGRKRLIRWGPRNIDIDIILYGDETINTDRLIVPHPRYKERAFVLMPMREICECDCAVPEDYSVKRVSWED